MTRPSRSYRAPIPDVSEGFLVSYEKDPPNLEIIVALEIYRRRK